MNKYIKIGFGFMLGFCSLVSCDTMDTENLEAYDEELVWSNKSNADAFVYNVYRDVIGLYTGRLAVEGRTPNACDFTGFSQNDFAAENIDRYYDAGFDKFGVLRKCNMIIEKSEASNSISEIDRQALVAEGHLLRGLVYFYQAKTMGRFVPINRVLTTEDTEAFKTPITKDVSESYQYIIEDLDAAIAGMPEESESGRMNKWTAYGFKSRVCLQAYAYTKDASYLDQAIEAADAVINSGKYSIDPDFENIFLEAGKYSSEIILGKYYLSENTTVGAIPELINVVPNVNDNNLKFEGEYVCGPQFEMKKGQTFIGWAFACPTQNLVDEYFVIDEEDGKEKRWNETSQYKNNVVNDLSNLQVGSYTYLPAEGVSILPGARKASWTVPGNEDFDETEKGKGILMAGRVTTDRNLVDILYKNRDKRMDATIVRDSVTWFEEMVTLCCNGNLWSNVSGTDANGHRTLSNYIWKKGVYPVDPFLGASNITDYHYVVLRLGEIYLNKAEALLLKGEVAKAMEAINVTHVQHGGMPEMTANSLSEAWKCYKRERRIELAWENDYYWSLLRWGKIGGDANDGKAPGDVIDDLNEPVYKIQITKDRKRFYIQQIKTYRSWNRKFSTKRYLLPIPQGQLDTRAASGIMDAQNEGW